MSNIDINGDVRVFTVVTENHMLYFIGEPFLGSKDYFDKNIKSTYKSWFDVKDSVSIRPYIATPTSWNPCNTGKHIQ